VGAPAFRPVKLRQKKAGFSPGAVRQFPHEYWRSLEESAGAKARNQSNLYRRTKVRRSHKTKIAAAKHFFRKLFSRIDLMAFTARLKPCPFCKRHFFRTL
jgi:hypothetical protein